MNSTPTLLKLSQRGADFRHWYTLAAADIQRVCADRGWDCDRFIDILALTSPRISVRRNIRVALAYMSGGTLATDLTRSTHAAVAHYELTGEIRGPKTSAFARALKGDLSAVVLDVWMARALAVDQHQFDKASIRERASARVIRVADSLDWQPAEAQAAIWAGVVRQFGKNVKSFTISDELTLFD